DNNRDTRGGFSPVPGLRNVERESAARVAVVVGVQHADARRVVGAQAARAQPLYERVVVAASGVEEPAAHGVEGRRQRIERLLHAREAAQRAIEIEGVVGGARGGGEAASIPGVWRPPSRRRPP